MLKIVSFSLFLILFSSLSALDEELSLGLPFEEPGLITYQCPPQKKKKKKQGSKLLFYKNILAEGRISYFYPNSGRVRRIYSKAPLYNIEASGRVYNDLYAWGSLGYFTASGKTVDDGEACHLTLVPMAGGLKYIYRAFYVQPYAGAGLLVGYVHETANAPDLIHSLSKWGAGGIFKVGTLVVKGSFFFDAFVDYSLLSVTMSHNSSKQVLFPSLNVSGFSFGGGFGYQF